MRTLLVLALAVAGLGCAPTISIARVVPSQVRLGNAVRSVSVTADHGGVLETLLLERSRRDDALARAAAQRIESGLVQRQRWQVVGGCQLPCPTSDATFEVRVGTVDFTPVVLDKDGKVTTPARARVDLQLSALRPNGEIFWQGTFTGTSDSPGDQGKPRREPLFDAAALAAADGFLAATTREEKRDLFLLRKVDALEAGNKALAAGDTGAALSAYRAVLATQPQSADALYSIGVALLASGDLPGARDAFAKAAALNGTFSWAVKNVDSRLQDLAALDGE